MPLYEYLCENCGHQFERIQKFSDPPVEACPKCGSPVRKLVSSPAFQFKGSGWYVTDYARKSEPTKEKSGSAGESGSSTEKANKESKDTSKESATDSSSKESKPKDPPSSSSTKSES